MSGEITQVTVEIVPYVTAAVSVYGGAVLAKVEDDAADATVAFGRRLLQRIFGQKRDGEPLPPALAKVIANPGDLDYLGTLRATIRDVLENDTQMLAEVREILAQATPTVTAGPQSAQADHGGIAQSIVASGNVNAPHTVNHVINGPSISAGRDVTLLPGQHDDPPHSRLSGLMPKAAEQSGQPSGGRVSEGGSPGEAGARDTRERKSLQAGRDLYFVQGDIKIINAAPGDGGRRQVLAQGSCVWGNIPPRNPSFAGRKGLLASARNVLTSTARAPAYVLHGIGGVGKTQIAMEYTYKFAGEYDIIWWIDAEQASVIGEQFAALGAELGITPRGAPFPVAQETVLASLRQVSKWLIIFDNAQTLQDIKEWLPGGKGHILITSRLRAWDEIATLAEVSVLDRPESVGILRGRVPDLSETDANQLADAVGDLPLAIVQAAGYMAESGASAREYKDLLTERTTDILELGRPLTYPRSLVAATKLGLEQLRDTDPSAAELIEICTFLAPEPVPARWFTQSAAQLPELLADRVADPFTRGEVLMSVGRSSLAQIGQNGLVMHRLTQAIIRDCMRPEDLRESRKFAEAILTAILPDDTRSPENWPEWARVMPHLLALNPSMTCDPSIQGAAVDAAWYLARRGDLLAGRDLAHELYVAWRSRLGPDAGSTLKAGTAFAAALRRMGCPEEARQIDRDIFERRRRLLGENHPSTLASASNLAFDLRRSGDLKAARELDEDTLARRWQVRGMDHPSTFVTASNLADDLRALGELRAARDLDEDTLGRCRRVQGADHPQTLGLASGLGADLRALGEYAAARKIDEDTLARRRRILGEDHPDTLLSASNFAVDMRRLGEAEAAREIDEDTLARRRRILGEDHPDTQRSKHNLAEDLRALGEIAPHGRGEL